MMSIFVSTGHWWVAQDKKALLHLPQLLQREVLHRTTEFEPEVSPLSDKSIIQTQDCLELPCNKFVNSLILAYTANKIFKYSTRSSIIEILCWVDIIDIHLFINLNSEIVYSLEVIVRILIT